jgi:hypothetical protein
VVTGRRSTGTTTAPASGLGLGATSPPHARRRRQNSGKACELGAKQVHGSLPDLGAVSWRAGETGGWDGDSAPRHYSSGGSEPAHVRSHSALRLAIVSADTMGLSREQVLAQSGQPGGDPALALFQGTNKPSRFGFATSPNNSCVPHWSEDCRTQRPSPSPLTHRSITASTKGVRARMGSRGYATTSLSHFGAERYFRPGTRLSRHSASQRCRRVTYMDSLVTRAKQH